MTVIVSTIWGGRINIVSDRRISRRLSSNEAEIIDDDSNKLLVVQCYGSIFTIAYTGIAVAHRVWMDSAIAGCLAHRKLDSALIQPSSPLLSRPAFTPISELKINLNGVLNSDPRSKLENIELLVQGWKYGKKRLIPFACNLKRGAPELNGNRYFELTHYPVAKFFRENPYGLWGVTLGDDGGEITKAVEKLRTMVGFSHDDIEQQLSLAVYNRSRETQTVSPSSVALQLDPIIGDGQVKFTYYPHESSKNGHPLLNPWVMTPQMICSPSTSTSAFSPISNCGNYVLGGFSDENTHLNVVTRLPSDHAMPAGKGAIWFKFQQRPVTP